MERRRRPGRKLKPRTGDIVMAVKDFATRITPPPLLTDTRDSRRQVFSGMQGIVHGWAVGIPGYYDVSFEVGDNGTRRVEVPPDCIDVVL